MLLEPVIFLCLSRSAVFPYMCSFLLIFLIIAVIFDLSSNYVRYFAPEIAQIACDCTPQVVPAPKRHQEAQFSWIGESQSHTQTSPLQRYCFSCPHTFRNGFCRRELPLEVLWMLSPEQKDHGVLSHLFCALDDRYKAQYRAKGCQNPKLCLGRPKCGHLLAGRRLGIWSRWLRMEVSIFKQTSDGQCPSDTERALYGCQQRPRQRQVQKRKGEGEQSEFCQLTLLATVGKRIHGLACYGFDFLHALQCKPEQPLPGRTDGCGPTGDGGCTSSGLSGSDQGPGRRASHARQSRQGERPAWIEEFASGGQALGPRKETTQGSDRSENCPPYDVDPTSDRRHQDVGKPIGFLSSSSSHPHRACHQGSKGGYIHQPDNSAPRGRWNWILCRAYPATRAYRGNRDSRGGCQSRGGKTSHSIADCVEGMCKLLGTSARGPARSSGCRDSVRRGEQRQRGRAEQKRQRSLEPFGGPQS